MSKKILKFAIIFVVAPWLFCCRPVWADEPATSASHSNVQQWIDCIKVSHSRAKRAKFGFRLWREVKLSFFTHYSDSEIDQISNLLNAQDDPVVYWSALSLAAIGPDARRAAPALQKARLKWRGYYCANPTAQTVQTLRFLEGAILDLGIELPHIDCPSTSGPSDTPAQTP
jgi:hypothetical protein